MVVVTTSGNRAGGHDGGTGLQWRDRHFALPGYAVAGGAQRGRRRGGDLQGDAGPHEQGQHLFTKKNRLKPHGIKWGSYHYSSGSDVVLQVENYLNHAQPEADELIALDYEPSSSGPNMSYAQMIEFVELIRAATGRYPVIYGGPLLRETLAGVTHSTGQTARSGMRATTSRGRRSGASWNSWTLWQTPTATAVRSRGNRAGLRRLRPRHLQRIAGGPPATGRCRDEGAAARRRPARFRLRYGARRAGQKATRPRSHNCGR